MIHIHRSLRLNALILIAVLSAHLLTVQSIAASRDQDPLPSWNEGSNKQAIIDFVSNTTTPDHDDYIPGTKRIATFDNDVTLWAEQPLYFLVMYISDRIKTLAPDHPEWQYTEPFASALKGDLKAALGGGEQALMEMVMSTHAGVTASEFSESVSDWLKVSSHPDSGAPYTSMVYKPMLELLDYHRANGFKVFIVSGGGIDFLRVFAEEV